MKKYIICVLALVITVALAVTGFSANQNNKTEKEMIKTEKKITQKLNKLYKTKDMEKLLRKNNLYEDEIMKNMSEYISCTVEYNVSDEVINIFLNGVENKKDLDKLIKAYKFLYMANKDYSLIDKMYDFGEMSNFKNPYWTEKAYNELTDSIGGVLNEEEIVKYLNKGLTYEDISAANKLCFKGKMKINEILDQVVNGKEWVDIVDVIYPELKINKTLYKDVKPVELYRYVKDALVYEENINEVYDKKEKEKTKAFKLKENKHFEMIEEELKNKNLNFVIDDNMLTYAKEQIPELTKEEILTLMEEDYLIKDIKRGIKLSKKKGISIKRAIETDFNREAE